MKNVPVKIPIINERSTCLKIKASKIARAGGRILNNPGMTLVSPSEVFVEVSEIKNFPVEFKVSDVSNPPSIKTIMKDCELFSL